MNATDIAAWIGAATGTAALLLEAWQWRESHPHLGIGTKLSDTPGQVRTTAPLPGQHTETVLASIGYDADAIAGLKQRGIVG